MENVRIANMQEKQKFQQCAFGLLSFSAGCIIIQSIFVIVQLLCENEVLHRWTTLIDRLPLVLSNFVTNLGLANIVIAINHKQEGYRLVYSLHLLYMI